MISVLTASLTTSVPEWPIQRARKLGRVAHERALVPKPRVDESLLYGLDASVHHVAGRNAMRTSFGVVDSHLRDAVDGGRVVDGSVRIEEPTVSVVGVFAEADVACDIQGWIQRPKLFERENDRAFLVVRRGAFVVLWKYRCLYIHPY